MKRSFVFTAASFFVLLSVIFIPFPFNLSKIQFDITEFFFSGLIGFVSKNIFSKPLNDTHVHSDTTAMYILILLLVVLSVIITVVLSQIKAWAKYRDRIFKFIYLLASYYLALQLFKYGLDKVFKNQFYLPEPNTLYTPMGKVPRDLLYWSSMGTSHFYNVFLGIIEALAAIFLLIKRTRLIGLLLSFFVMINIVAVNFGFDISVKVFSLILLFLNVYLLIPYLKNLYQFFFSKQGTTAYPGGEVVLVKNHFLSSSVKWFVIGIILLESFYPFVRAGNFNGDLAKRPYLHGAYEVKEFIAGVDTLEPHNFPFKRFFVHKDSYMIFQDQQDEMADYKLSATSKASEYLLTDYQMRQTRLQLTYNEADSLLTFQYFKGEQLNKITGKALDWRKMTALKKEFHWTIDQ